MFTFKTLTTAAVTLAATSALGAAGASTASAAQFAHTPSGNIRCVAANYGGPGWSLTCSVKDIRRTLRISTSGRAYAVPYKAIPKRGTTLQYGGGTYHLGGKRFHCSSFETGLSCGTVGDGGSIWLSRESVETYN